MATDTTTSEDIDYSLEEQVGFMLRIASQRHAAIFQSNIVGKLTPTQFSTLIRLAEVGRASQNHLGRLAAMDVATIKGVVDRLRAKGLIQSTPDLVDKRRSIITLSEKGAAFVNDLKQAGLHITEKTLAPLSAKEQTTFLKLLRKMS
ncbi:MAG: MarR family transcriptional regulator [Litoreibacter sp.]|uniref:MarR family winged helix-turn-helix transcriptional regulator n=1 Tax=Litoreibacter sp. TaxID=1969459 RepID=UPI0032978228